MRLLSGVLLLAACSEHKADQPPPKAAPVQFEAGTGTGPEAMVRHGERLSRVLGCRGCHGGDLTGEPWLEEPEFAVLFSSNLTRTISAYSDVQFAHAVREGTRPDGSDLWEMPSHVFTGLSEPDMAALIAWLRTVPPSGEARPRIVIGPEGRREIGAGLFKSASQLVSEDRNLAPSRLDGRHERARYMTRATCGECHGVTLEGESPPVPEAVARPDLIVAAAYSRDEFRRLMRTGVAKDGRTLALMPEVARGRFAYLTDSEIDAIHDYLVARANQPQ